MPKKQLDGQLVAALLSMPHQREGIPLVPGETLWQYVERLQQELSAVAAIAEKALHMHPLTPLVIQEVGKDVANPVLHVAVEGPLWLAYSSEVVAQEIPKREVRKYQVHVRTIAEIKEEAVALGIDVSGLGRNKKAMEKAIEKGKLLQKPARNMVLCRFCGHPTMHLGDVCYGCGHKPPVPEPEPTPEPEPEPIQEPEPEPPISEPEPIQEPEPEPPISEPELIQEPEPPISEPEPIQEPEPPISEPEPIQEPEPPISEPPVSEPEPEPPRHKGAKSKVSKSTSTPDVDLFDLINDTPVNSGQPQGTVSLAQRMQAGTGTAVKPVSGRFGDIYKKAARFDVESAIQSHQNVHGSRG